DLDDTFNPLLVVTGTDAGANYANGKVGLVAASQGSCSVGGDCTFDNFYADSAEPRLAIGSAGGFPAVSWPGSLACLWVLESSSSVGTGAVWTEVTADKIVYTAGTKTHTGTTLMADDGPTYYRLRKL